MLILSSEFGSAVVSNYVLVRGPGADQKLKARSPYAARLAFKHLVEALQLSGFQMVVTEEGRPGRFRARRTASAAGVDSTDQRAEAILRQRGRERPQSHDVLYDPAVKLAAETLAFASVAVGIRRLITLGARDLVDKHFPGVVTQEWSPTDEDVREAHNDEGRHARDVLKVLSAAGEPADRISELERSFGVRR